MSLFSSKPDLVIHSSEPYNAEPPLHLLSAVLETPQALFYVRSHGPVPQIDAATHRLKVAGLVRTPLDLGMHDLQTAFPRHTVTAAMQCAGNRRADMLQVKPVSGDPWSAGAIGNARWTGVRLGDVLRAAGAQESAGLHVAFDSVDECETEGQTSRYGVSIPMTKAVAPEVLLAFEMNGEPLAAEHGAPLRAVVPGFAGVRSPKWLACVTVQDRPSDNRVQALEYKLFPPATTKDTADPAQGLTINDMPLNSAICEPAALAGLKAGRTRMRGWAVSGVSAHCAR